MKTGSKSESKRPLNSSRVLPNIKMFKKLVIFKASNIEVKTYHRSW